MSDSTYEEMTVEHLGDMATEEDVAQFREACRQYQLRTGASAQEATDYMWGSGDFLRRVLEETGR